MKKYIAIIALMSVGAAHAGVISLNSDWSEGGVAGIYSAESSTGYTVDHLSTNSANASRYAYQTVSNGDFASEALNIGDTATLSFTLTTFGVTGPASGNEAFRIALWDEGTGASISSRMDYNDPVGPTTHRIAYKTSGATETAIGSATGNTQSGLIPSGGGWAVKNDAEDVTLSFTRTATDTYDVSLDWGDVNLSDTYGGLTIDSIDAVGLRMNLQNRNGYTISDLSVEVVPEPATLGLMGLVGGAMLAIRRFMI